MDKGAQEMPSVWIRPGKAASGEKEDKKQFHSASRHHFASCC